MSNEIDVYWETIPATEMTDKNIDDIIAYMRKQRGLMEKGIKAKKVEGPKRKVDLADLGFAKKAEEAPPTPLKRRSW